jgi:hypothetical protein
MTPCRDTLLILRQSAIFSTIWVENLQQEWNKTCDFTLHKSFFYLEKSPKPLNMRMFPALNIDLEL